MPTSGPFAARMDATTLAEVMTIADDGPFEAPPKGNESAVHRQLPGVRRRPATPGRSWPDRGQAIRGPDGRPSICPMKAATGHCCNLWSEGGSVGQIGSDFSPGPADPPGGIG